MLIMVEAVLTGHDLGPFEPVVGTAQIHVGQQETIAGLMLSDADIENTPGRLRARYWPHSQVGKQAPAGDGYYVQKVGDRRVHIVPVKIV